MWNTKEICQKKKGTFNGTGVDIHIYTLDFNKKQFTPLKSKVNIEKEITIIVSHYIIKIGIFEERSYFVTQYPFLYIVTPHHTSVAIALLEPKVRPP